MAAEKNPSVIKRKHRGFMHHLSSAACEWFLIFLLFVNASLSYLLAKFARYCELKTPCLLCSRLDSEKNPGCYWNLLCNNHRQEISCLVSCSIHGKFADVHGMCEECLAPIVSQNKSNPDSYRLLVGKSWLDVDRSVLQNLVLNKNIRLGSPDHRMCSCCSKTWRVKSNTERLLDLTPVGYGASKANVKPPLPRAPGRSRFSRRDSMKRLRDKFTGQVTTVSNSVDSLSHVGYTKLKISSDTESEFPFSEDDDDGINNKNNVGRCKSCGKNENEVQFERRVVNAEKPSHPNLLDFSEDKNVNSLTPDLISLNDGPQTPDVSKGSFGALVDASKSSDALPHMPALSVLSELLSLCSVPSSSNNSALPKKIDVGETRERKDTSVPKDTEASPGTSSVDARPLESNNNVNQTDASTQTDETIELSERRTLEPTNASDSTKSEEDVEKSQPEVSTSESGLLSKDNSPKSHDDKEDKPTMDEEDSKKNDSNNESLDGTTISDIEGENIVDRLKRQVEHDRTYMNNLYKELEEERNAAAIAANQAMAMITRLQEEKAALHMEALQYLRMMEEQAEYDMEALGRANDLLAEKEKELQDLEIELEFYRNNFLDESGVHNLQKETLVVDSRPSVITENGTSNLKTKPNGDGEGINNFEDEKVFILQSLKKLEKKLLHCEKIKVEVENLHDLSRENEENGSLVHYEISVSNGNPTSDEENDNFVHENGGKLIKSAVFEKEIAELYDRLEALEADKNFIKCTCDLLRNGKDGIQLVEEIANQLHELRKIEFKKR